MIGYVYARGFNRSHYMTSPIPQIERQRLFNIPMQQVGRNGDSRINFDHLRSLKH